MWEALHATLGFDMNRPIWIDNVAEVVLINNFFWNITYSLPLMAFAPSCAFDVL